MPVLKLNEQNFRNITQTHLIMYLLIVTLYFLLVLHIQHFLPADCNKCVLQEKNAEVCRIFLRTQTRTIILNTSFPIQKFAVTKMRWRGFTTLLRTFEVALKWILKYYFLALSSSKQSPAVPSEAIPSLLVAEGKSVAHSVLKIPVSSDSLDLSRIISTKCFLPFSFFPPSFLP